MTITVKIKHDQPECNMNIAVYQCRANVREGELSTSMTPPTILEPGEEATFYVWSLQDLLIKEVLQ